MHEAIVLALAWVAGLCLGAFFFGGLWWTVCKSMASQWPGLWLSVSLLLRMSIAITGFYFVGREHWLRVVVCLLGFVIARFVMQRLTQPSNGNPTRPAQETSHAH